MTVTEFARLFTDCLPYAPNEQQEAVIGALSRFCSASTPPLSVFIVNGYAGTGKTSLTGALVKALRAVGRQVVLLAPTGRAAKVFGAAAGAPAFTIHRYIYAGGGDGIPSLRQNKADGAVFIVDEASMIGDASTGGDSSTRVGLLEDLIEFVFTADNTRLILMGDTAQLPPVGAEVSPAMQPARYKQLGLHVSRATLTATVRQKAGSGILANATWLRRAMLVDPLPLPRIFTGHEDVSVTDSGEDVADLLGRLYREQGTESTIVITRSNLRATRFNLGIRQVIFDRDELLCRGERLLVAKNNYVWGTGPKGLDFIANGDVGEVTAIHSVEEKYGFRFADITLQLAGRDDEITCKIMLDTLTDESASLSAERMASLAMQRMADPDVAAKGQTRSLRSDPYVSALQVKYAYCVTCHKAQGAQWPNVVIDMGGIAPGEQTLDFFRWLYTATTRATRRLIYLNPAEEFISQ